MKAAVTNYVLFALLCVTVLFVSMAVADEVAQAEPMDEEAKAAAAELGVISKPWGAELASGRCVKGCCSRNFIGKCKVCCASDEEAKAAAAELSANPRPWAAKAKAAAAELSANPRPTVGCKGKGSCSRAERKP